MKKLLIVLGCAVAVVMCTAKKTGYTGSEVTDFASIERNQQTKRASLLITTPGKWELYGSPTSDGAYRDKLIASDRGAGNFTLEVPTGQRTYFYLVTGEGSGPLAETHLPMTGGYNFRDLGGIQTSDGRHVKWGKILRSDDLHHLTDADLQYLESVPLTRIVDFRSAEEIAAAPDRVPTGATDVALSISPGNLSMSELLGSMTEMQVDSVMIAMNVMFVTDEGIVDTYRQFLALLQDEAKSPLMFHCSAGKDRTGMAGALILYALGADDDTVMENYLASNEFLRDKYASIIAEHPNARSLFVVKQQFLQAGIDRIRADHGSVATYLENTLNVDLGRLRKTYLQ